MVKRELIQFLEPFHDDIRIVVRGANKNLMAPISYELEYKPFTDERNAIVIINMKSCGAIDTGVSG